MGQAEDLHIAKHAGDPSLSSSHRVLNYMVEDVHKNMHFFYSHHMVGEIVNFTHTFKKHYKSYKCYIIGCTYILQVKGSF